MSASKHFKPSEFIKDVHGNDFSKGDYNMRQIMRLRAARAAFMALPRHEQEHLARLADQFPGRTVRGYGTITAFEVLAKIAFSQVDPDGAIDAIFDKMDQTVERKPDEAA